MGAYRLDSISQLSRQMLFTPIPRRLEQLDAAEDLLLKLCPDQTYTIEEVTFAITGFELKRADQSRLTGLALQHDLGLLLEAVSESLQLHVNASPEPVLCIEDVAQRLGVTSKSVQRWRRRGLPARRYTFADGKRRIGFRSSSVQRFAGSPSAAEQLPTIDTIKRDLPWLMHQAKVLADRGYWDLLIAQRLTRACGLAPLSIVQVLREQAPDLHPVAPPPAQLRQMVVEHREAGRSIKSIACETGLPVYGVYRIVLEARMNRVIRKKVHFYDDPIYHQPDASAAVEAIAAQEPITASAEPADNRVPRDIPPYLRDLYRTPLLSPARERGLFLKYQYLRMLCAEHQKSLDPQVSGYRQLKRFDSLRRTARRLRSQIVEANLRLVVSVARKHVRPSVSLMELVSEGNIILMRAADSFDVHRGNRFSTYAVYALMRGFARYVPATTTAQKHLAEPEFFRQVGDPGSSRDADLAVARDQVQQLLGRLDRRERDVLATRFGLTPSAIPMTCREAGRAMRLSSQRILQIEQQAMAKLRGLVRD